MFCVVRSARAYSKVSGGKFLANNVVFRSLNFVKQVDDAHVKLTQAKTSDKVAMLLDQIGSNKELLYLLSLFHFECGKLGISGENALARTPSLKYYWYRMFKLAPINNSFWELCHLLNISNHNHRLSRNIADLGLLDPKNFSSSVYKQLQSGRYNDVDFSSVQTTAFERPEFSEEDAEHKKEAPGTK